MLEKGFDIDTIAEISKLTTEEIKLLWHRKAYRFRVMVSCWMPEIAPFWVLFVGRGMMPLTITSISVISIHD
jgi:hypothetical protein